jgi:hypothetical protein
MLELETVDEGEGGGMLAHGARVGASAIRFVDRPIPTTD